MTDGAITIRCVAIRSRPATRYNERMRPVMPGRMTLDILREAS